MVINTDHVRTIRKEIIKRYPFLNGEEEQRFLLETGGIEKSGLPVHKQIETMLKVLVNPHAIIFEKRCPCGKTPGITSQASGKWLPSCSIEDRILRAIIPTWNRILIPDEAIDGLIQTCIQDQDKYDAVIIDLRRNEGGSPVLAQKVAALFFKDNVNYGTSVWREPGAFGRIYMFVARSVATIWQKDFRYDCCSGEGLYRELYKYECIMDKRRPHREVFVDKPVAILTSNRTFSSGELFTAPFKVTGRATIIGEKTGGGSAYPWPFIVSIDGHEYVVKIPTRRFYLKGETKPIEETGITPDIVCRSDDAMGVAAEFLTTRMMAPACTAAPVL